MKTILIVDDEPAVLNLLTLYLHGSYHVLQAADGTEAVQIAARFDGEIHLAVIDRGVRGRHGIDIACEVTKSRPAMPVLLISGDTEDHLSGFAKGGIRPAFLQKPFSGRELIAKIGQLLGGAQATDAGI